MYFTLSQKALRLERSLDYALHYQARHHLSTKSELALGLSVSVSCPVCLPLFTIFQGSKELKVSLMFLRWQENLAQF